MCRMLAKISVDETGILDEMLMCPYSLKYLSQNGWQPADPETRGRHLDGCGMAFSTGESVEVHKRSKENAWDESYQQLARTSRSKIFLAHNRLASEGLETTAGATHPFSISAKDNTFALCHNGGIRTFMPEAKQNHTSDSLIFLQRLIDASGKNDGDSIFSRLTNIAANTDYSSLCAFLISENDLFVWRVFNDTVSAKAADYEKYYTLYMSLKKNSILFSSEPLDDSSWMLIENKTFLHLQVQTNNIAIQYRLL
jgi:predicted glutamine amidotransferase